MARCIQQIRPKVYDWDFNVFELDRASGHRPLFAVVMALLEEQGLLDGWLLDRPVVERFLTAAEAAYNRNPYHNNTHAADVTQTSAVIMRSVHEFLGRPEGAGSGGAADAAAAAMGALLCHHNSHGQQQQQQRNHLHNSGGGKPAGNCGSACGAEGGGLTPLERFCVIFASAVHDLGHPGLNNDFLIRARDKQAIVYNDKSVNENMHCSRAFEVALEEQGCDVFSRFSDAEYAQARSLIVGMVLSTDMAVHFDLLKRFNATVQACPDPRLWDEKDRALLLQMTVHLADLANPARPFPLAAAWAERVVTEFLAQGDLEARRGMSVTPFCDRARVSMPAAQLGFLKTFAQPTLEAFAAVAPGFVTMATPCLEETRLKWEFLLDAGVKHPSQGEYPPFTRELQDAVEQRRAEAAGEQAALARRRDQELQRWLGERQQRRRQQELDQEQKQQERERELQQPQQTAAVAAAAAAAAAAVVKQQPDEEQRWQLREQPQQQSA